MTDFADAHRPTLEDRLEAGEQLHGIVAATQQSTFSGRAVAIGVTDRRLVIQPLDRRGRPSGDAESIAPEQIASARAADAGNMSLTVSLMNDAAATLVVKRTDGRKLKLIIMRGTGVFGGLGGGEQQREGVEALAEWFRRLEGSAS